MTLSVTRLRSNETHRRFSFNCRFGAPSTDVITSNSTSLATEASCNLEHDRLSPRLAPMQLLQYTRALSPHNQISPLNVIVNT